MRVLSVREELTVDMLGCRSSRRIVVVGFHSVLHEDGFLFSCTQSRRTTSVHCEVSVMKKFKCS